MRIRTIHPSVRVDELYEFKPTGGGFHEGEVPDAIGDLLLSISRPGEYTKVEVEQAPAASDVQEQAPIASETTVQGEIVTEGDDKDDGSKLLDTDESPAGDEPPASEPPPSEPESGLPPADAGKGRRTRR